MHAANLSERKGGALLLEAVQGKFPRLVRIWADQGYRGEFQTWASELLNLEFEVVYPWWRQIQRYLPDVPTDGEWLQGDSKKVGGGAYLRLVERTFARLTFQRRLNRDYEFLMSTSESLTYLAMIRIMLRRLAC